LHDLSQRKIEALFPRAFLWDVMLIKSVVEKGKDLEMYRVSGDGIEVLFLSFISDSSSLTWYSLL